MVPSDRENKAVEDDRVIGVQGQAFISNLWLRETPFKSEHFNKLLMQMRAKHEDI